MSSLSRQQQLIVGALGLLTIIVLAVLCAIVYISMSSASAPLNREGRDGGPATPIATALTTPLFPTWTPESTSTPFLAPTATPRALDDDALAVLEQVETDVITVRLLLPKTPVLRWSTSRRQLRSRYGDIFESEEWQEELSSLTVALATLDLMSPDTDLTLVLTDISVEQSPSYYDPEDNGVYILHDVDPTSPFGRMLYAHSYGHVLQDHNFGLDSLGIPITELFQYADQALAATSLSEGDAALTQGQYSATFFSDAERVQAQQAAQKHGGSVLNSAPGAIRELYLFPHSAGKDFAQALFDSGGWQAISDAYADPPASTEHILHPQSYLDGDQPVQILIPSLSSILGSGWQLAYDDTLGELMLRIYLAGRIEAAEASAAAEGWGGDRCAIYQNDATDETVMLLQVEWDTVADAEEFLQAYTSYADARFGLASSDTIAGGACWEGSDVLCIVRSSDTVIGVLGPDRETADRVLAVSTP
jgi:hypothetical protein